MRYFEPGFNISRYQNIILNRAKYGKTRTYFFKLKYQSSKSVHAHINIVTGATKGK
jgi:hypothetical protein